jgi:hypothetical protein
VREDAWEELIRPDTRRVVAKRRVGRREATSGPIERRPLVDPRLFGAVASLAGQSAWHRDEATGVFTQPGAEDDIPKAEIEPIKKGTNHDRD